VDPVREVRGPGRVEAPDEDQFGHVVGAADLAVHEASFRRNPYHEGPGAAEPPPIKYRFTTETQRHREESLDFIGFTIPGFSLCLCGVFLLMRCGRARCGEDSGSWRPGSDGDDFVGRLDPFGRDRDPEPPGVVEVDRAARLVRGVERDPRRVLAAD